MKKKRRHEVDYNAKNRVKFFCQTSCQKSPDLMFNNVEFFICLMKETWCPNALLMNYLPLPLYPMDDYVCLHLSFFFPSKKLTQKYIYFFRFSITLSLSLSHHLFLHIRAKNGTQILTKRG